MGALTCWAMGGYLAYRTVPQFPPIGDRVIIALRSIASAQATPSEAIQSLQRDAESLLEKEGVTLRSRRYLCSGQQAPPHSGT